MSPSKTAIALLLSVAFASEAHADDGESPHDRWEAMPNALEIHTGLGTPVGFLGLVYDRVLWSRWSASAGFGVSGGREGASLQLAAGTRFRFIQAKNGVYLGIDYSTGGWRLTPMPAASWSGTSMSRPTIVYAERAHWLQGSIGYDIRSDSGGVFRPYLGIAFMLNPESRRCVYESTGTPCEAQRRDYEGDTIMVLGLAFGGAR